MSPQDYNPNLNKVERVLHREMSISLALGLIALLGGLFFFLAGRPWSFMLIVAGPLLAAALGKWIFLRSEKRKRGEA